MNKAVYIFVYLFLALAGGALWFEIQLNDKRSELTHRNRMQEDYFVRVAKTIEREEPAKDASFEIKKDVSPVEARLVDAPEMDNLLAEYNAPLEQQSLKTYEWDGMAVREQLRMVYVLDAEGKPVMDGNQPLMRGKGTEQELLEALLESAKAQQQRLNTTRAELAAMRGRLEEIVKELNALKPIARQDKVTIVERDAKIAKLEGEKRALEDEITKKKAEIEELNTEITSLKDELATAKDELEEKKEEIAKLQKTVEQLKKLMQEMIASRGTESARAGTAVASIPLGDKGTIAIADNESMFAVVRFTDQAMKELKGGDKNNSNPLPALELGVKRGETFVGRLRIRQEIKGKNFVICDILGTWEQDKMKKDDVVFAD